MNKENKFNFEKFSEAGSIQFDILRPGGNDTALVRGIITDPEKRKKINDEVMKFYPDVEQVGFISLGENPQLLMAGGEFCGNATRSTAWLALNGKSGSVNIQVSGVENKLAAGILPNGEAFSQMPIYKNPEKIKPDQDPESFIVEMEGITHLVTFNTSSIEGLDEEQIKQQAMDIIEKKGLDKYPASGVIYVSKKDSGWSVKPVVFVRDINTLFYETACGSGTTALGLVLAKQKGGSISEVSVLQPSGLPIKISVEFDGKSFGYTQISGPIAPLTSGSLEIDENQTFVIEKISNAQQLRKALVEGELIKLYQDIFSAPPYFEIFSDAEVQDFFEEYITKGLLFLAWGNNRVIGFGAALPLSTQAEIVEIGKPFQISPEKTWYMADLGVSSSYRRKGIGEKLVQARLREIKSGSIVLMRTSIDNIASQTLYKNLGFKKIQGMFQQVTQTRTDGSIKNDKRIFLIKEV